MAISNGYATREEFRSYTALDTSFTNDDAEIDAAIEAVSRQIDRWCGRVFYQDDAATRYYTPRYLEELTLDDVRTITSFETGTDSKTWGTTWVEDTDYFLEPLNPLDGQPYTKAIPWESTGKQLPVNVLRGVKIVGDFGWAAIPAAVHSACLLQTNRIHERRNAPFGTAGAVDTGVAFLKASLDPDVKNMLRNYRALSPVVS